jgi:hypothetical protein
LEVSGMKTKRALVNISNKNKCFKTLFLIH